MSADKQPVALTAGIIRTDRTMADGRTIRYYDDGVVARTAVDQRQVDAMPGIGDLRLDPLVNEWVIVASHRQRRAFLPPKELCPLCPTHDNLASEIPESSYQVAVFDNRTPALTAPHEDFRHGVITGFDTPDVPAAGKCEVVCYTDQHEGSFGELSLHQIRMVMEAWRDRTRELSTLSYIEQVFPFENRGEEVGVTLNHPHGQIYAYSFITPRTQNMLDVAEAHLKKTGRVLMDDIVARELKDELRIVAQNSEWVAYVPYASRYPFEIHVAPRRSVPDLAELDDVAADAFPEIAKEVMQRLDGVFGIQMAYIGAWHQAPVRTGRDALRAHWQITSVRRAPGKLKYLAGSESAMNAFVMDMKPEQSAGQLRDVKLK